MVRKIINKNKEKYDIYESEDEEYPVIDNSVINELIYFNLFGCGRNFLKNISVACERACM